MVKLGPKYNKNKCYQLAKRSLVKESILGSLF